MREPNKNYIRLPLEGAFNVRDLGGYASGGGEPLRFHQFLRADGLARLTREDVQFLLDYGVRTVIDLRSEAELLRDPDVLADCSGIDYLHISLAEEGNLRDTQIPDFTLKALYQSIAENKELVGEVFHAIAGARDGCILYHCSAGKDRTGMVSMLLMWLAGADELDIAANYEVSATYTDRMVRKIFETQNVPEALKDLFGSPAVTIREIFSRLYTQYGSAEAYLKACGITDREMIKIKGKLI